ncbi:MAG: SGNH/GDSL hydrolase family protein [Armatimonadetes bacterium]|nr:SGNH/GDSL hydrolase family protein [Armatimonadota bacterium]
MICRSTLLSLSYLLLAQSLAAAELPVIQARSGLGNLFSRLKSGQPTTIAYLGGSITAGGGASHPSKTWRLLSLEWFRKEFPEVNLTEADASIGGTGSTLAAFRLRKDALSARPHLVFVEFAVNDTGTPNPLIDRAMEGIVRQIWKANRAADICFIYTLADSFLPGLKENRLPQAMARHEKLAAYYGIPSVNVALAVGRRLIAGEMPWSDFSKDSCHPTDVGYEIFADAITGFLASQRNAAARPHRLKKAATPDCWENARLLDAWDTRHDSGWRKDDRLSLERFPHLLVTDRPDAELSFEFEGDTLGGYYYLGQDTGMFAISIDGKPWEEINPFDQWAAQFARPHYRFFATDLAPGNHTCRIKTLSRKDERSLGTWTRLGYFLVNGGTR